MKFRIIGLNIVKYAGKICIGHNCDFEYPPYELDKYVLSLIDERHRFYELTLKESYGECGSGWTTASYGDAYIEPVDHIRPFGYRPKGMYSFELEEDKDGLFDISALSVDGWRERETDIAGVFSFSFDGGDGYYPCGWVSVNLDKFEKLPRAMDKRPVWIFKGASGLGKSTIACSVARADEDISMFETDSVAVDELPEVITADIIVLGNRHQFSVDDIKQRLLGDPKVIIVDFH